ncbi:erythromycin esterase family protein [Catenulispora subtropica]|uniref:Erythromycin esterase n=1 Tax=Catenulispora subtropica TaxID=450798 RepID=A0ABP5EVM5_9ACTN
MAAPLRTPDDLDSLVDRLGRARVVLLGEASHGTAEYYLWRAALSRRLIAERGFSFVAVEGDWPDCFRVNRWVKNRAEQDLTAVDVLRRYERWPRWMWANEEVASFLGWLQEFNERSGADVGFYGLDVYSLWESMHAVINYLSRHLPEALDSAREAFACFEPYGQDPQRYARATRLVPTSCEDEVVALLTDLRHYASALDGDPEASLDARQNAEVMAGAERYYRAMVAADARSWNIRDRHMADTLDRLLAHHGPASKAIVWEHNTHVGDARATPMAGHGMVNVGQLVRRHHAADDVAIVGFAGYRGSVIAAEAWGTAAERLTVPPAPYGTHEALLHTALTEPSVLVFPDRRETGWLAQRRGHRAIGVVYHPEADEYANWVPTVMGRRYDALCFFDDTEALHPLHRESAHPGSEQEAWPSGR